MDEDLLHTLIQRIADARGKQRLERLLHETKQRLDLPRNQLRTTGTLEELQTAVAGAVIDGHITTGEIRKLTDEVEENGAQHVFLYTLTAAGEQRLTRRHFQHALDAPPQNATMAFYGDLPNNRVIFDPDRPELVVKQVHTGTFWELDKDDPAYEETDTRKVRVTVLRRRRAVNLLRIDSDAGHVEVRLDRLKGKNDQALALEALSDFQNRFAGIVDFEAHFEPIDIRSAFPAIVAAEDETFMTVDYASDVAARQFIASRRDPNAQRQDIRQHPNHHLKGDTYGRESLHVYWRMPNDPDNKIFTIISALTIDGREHTKVYFSAKVAAEELEHVIGRIRHFAGQAA